MKRACLTCLVMITALAVAWATAPAQAETASDTVYPATINRDVLGLYDSTTESKAHFTRLHRFLEMPLNHLGYRLTLHDVSTGLPSPREARRYRAVATWFSGRISNADAYLAWAAQLARDGLRFVIIDSVGAVGDASELPAINALLGELGINQAEYYVGDTKETRVAELDAAMLNGEAKLDPAALPGHNVYIEMPPPLPIAARPVARPLAKPTAISAAVKKSANLRASKATPKSVAAPAIAGAIPTAVPPRPLARHQVHLSVTDPAHRWVKATAAVQVITGDRGGFIAPEFSLRQDEKTGVMRWLVDPFRFLGLALGHSERAPVPDTTTVSGRRLYFSHIDGDGWNNVTEIEPYAARGERAAEVMLDQLIRPFPDLPVSVGLIAGDINPADGGRAEGAAVARALFALPQVEVASHTHTHPFYWRLFESYKRTDELANIAATVEKRPELASRSITSLINRWRAEAAVAAAPPAAPAPPLTDRAATVALPATASTPAEAADEPLFDLPRALATQPFDLQREIAGALDVSTGVAPPGKRARLYLWSGDCSPFEAALRSARVAGVRNLNGGDSRFDAEFPSMAYVAPLSRMVGAERQIYAVNSNENTYTNGWTGPFNAFEGLTATLDNTELPRRLKGFNLYYHSFSATKREGLDAVLVHLDRARLTRVAPIPASRYADIAEGFFSANIQQTAADRWLVTDRGDLQTMRFDNADQISVDIAASVGVIGSSRHAGALYVTLDPVVANAEIVTRAQRSASPPDAKPQMVDVQLSDSRWSLSAVSSSSCKMTADAQGFGPGEITWSGLSPGQYTLSVSRDARTMQVQRLTANAQGVLTALVSVSALQPLQLRLSCAE
jgi:polysaccharide biosynthesis protein PelA